MPEDWRAETNADWRGTPLRAGALAVWVVGNHKAVEGEIISWTREYVTVKPRRSSYCVVGGVPRAEDRDTREMAIDRSKVTVIESARSAEVEGIDREALANLELRAEVFDPSPWED